MRIGELAERAGTTPRALRYYEARGLLPARRAGNGYRVYDESDLRLIRQIRTLQECGFDLEETRPFVECLRAGHPEGDACADSLAVYRRKLAELDELIGDLAATRRQVAGQLARAEAARRGAGEPGTPAGTPRPPAPRCELTDALAHRTATGSPMDDERRQRRIGRDQP